MGLASPPLVEHQDFDVNSSNDAQLPSAPTEQTTPTTPKGSRTFDEIREAHRHRHRQSSESTPTGANEEGSWRQGEAFLIWEENEVRVVRGGG